MGRKGLQLLMDAKLQNSATGFLRCPGPGAGVSTSGPGKAGASCPLPPSRPQGLRLGVAESAEGQAPDPGQVPQRKVEWEAGGPGQTGLAGAPRWGAAGGDGPGGALSCGPGDGRAVLLGLHAEGRDA